MIVHMHIDLEEQVVPDILNAILKFVPAKQIKLFEPRDLPKLKKEDTKVFEALAHKVADTVAPTGRQIMRKQALAAACLRYDSLMDQQGDPDPSMRNALGALSRALREIFPHDASPIDRLATRTKRFDENGTYLATVYTPTKLGRRVWEILKARKAV